MESAGKQFEGGEVRDGIVDLYKKLEARDRDHTKSQRLRWRHKWRSEKETVIETSIDYVFKWKQLLLLTLSIGVRDGIKR